MALLSAEAMAELYQTAISSIVTGTVSSYSIGGDSFTKHNLDALQKGFTYWKKQASIEANGNSNVLLANVTYPDITGAIEE